MANHSPKQDNYVGKKTFAEAMAGAKVKREGPPTEQPTAEKQALEGSKEIGDTAEPKNPARGNGGKK